MCCAVMWCAVRWCDVMCCAVLCCDVMCCDVMCCYVQWCVVLWWVVMCEVWRDEFVTPKLILCISSHSTANHWQYFVSFSDTKMWSRLTQQCVLTLLNYIYYNDIVVSDWNFKIIVGQITITINCKLHCNYCTQCCLAGVFVPSVHVVKFVICLVCIVASFKLSCV